MTTTDAIMYAAGQEPAYVTYARPGSGGVIYDQVGFDVFDQWDRHIAWVPAHVPFDLWDVDAHLAAHGLRVPHGDDGVMTETHDYIICRVEQVS